MLQLFTGDRKIKQQNRIVYNNIDSVPTAELYIYMDTIQ